jgi:uncharacterized metal-binding protein YceD (DUF177 family)
VSEPFSILLLVAKVPAGGKHIHIETDEAQRRAITEALGIVDVEQLKAELDVRPMGAEAFSVRGALTASVVQTDVVTLEPVRQEVSEAIDLSLVPAADDSPSKRRARQQPDAADSDERDVYRGGRIDLGAIVFEHLALGLNPYPRSPDVEFSGHIEDDPAAAPSAFAALASLKRDKD